MPTATLYSSSSLFLIVILLVRSPPTRKCAGFACGRCRRFSTLCYFRRLCRDEQDAERWQHHPMPAGISMDRCGFMPLPACLHFTHYSGVCGFSLLRTWWAGVWTSSFCLSVCVYCLCAGWWDVVHFVLLR
jgi:hypothetical protein